VHPRFGVPHRAEVAVGALAAVLAATVDLRGAIGFSSFAVLVYYAIANACAFTLRPEEGPPPKVIPVFGVLGCVGLAFALPAMSIIVGASVLAVGMMLFWIRGLSGRVASRRSG
jgi:APA family basic amino acid/polyamine antiporter